MIAWLRRLRCRVLGCPASLMVFRRREPPWSVGIVCARCGTQWMMVSARPDGATFVRHQALRRPELAEFKGPDEVLPDDGAKESVLPLGEERYKC